MLFQYTLGKSGWFGGLYNRLHPCDRGSTPTKITTAVCNKFTVKKTFKKEQQEVHSFRQQQKRQLYVERLHKVYEIPSLKNN